VAQFRGLSAPTTKAHLFFRAVDGSVCLASRRNFRALRDQLPPLPADRHRRRGQQRGLGAIKADIRLPFAVPESPRPAYRCAALSGVAAGLFADQMRRLCLVRFARIVEPRP